MNRGMGAESLEDLGVDDVARVQDDVGGREELDGGWWQ